MSEQQFQVLITVLSDNKLEYLGIFVNISSIIATVLIAVYSVKRAFDDSLKQNNYEFRMQFYGDVVAYFASIKMYNEPYSLDKVKLIEYKKLYKKSSFLVNDLMFKQFVNVNRVIENAVKNEGIVQNNSGISKELEILENCMKWERENRNELTQSAFEKIKKQEATNETSI
ncbi:hypothetical protein PFZ59_07485 [Streptococcus suis]|uniref:hypothetical protein n=1 Tax=Streptococcus suis TaxID=1307 RepID=UPI00240D54C8|nr:hypothetical protein [Streptococcus suis]WFA75030.1 hypothetical protein PFZ59_07485 [Streptococcus suis]